MWKFNPVRIWELRSETKLTRYSFGKLVGASSNQVKEWETGVTVPSSDKIVGLCNEFSKEPNDFYR